MIFYLKISFQVNEAFRVDFSRQHVHLDQRQKKHLSENRYTYFF